MLRVTLKLCQSVFVTKKASLINHCGTLALLSTTEFDLSFKCHLPYYDSV